jgi:MerR family redox-sensitive transcriptional activator SoxR
MTQLSISELSARSGVAASALRYYESNGLITAERTAGGHRVYASTMLRRVAFIGAAQQVGLTLEEIRAELATLPSSRTPTKADWARLSRSWLPRVEARIAELTRMRDKLTSCIGCGCLSLRACGLYNPDDIAGANGAGPRYVLGDEPPKLP